VPTPESSAIRPASSHVVLSDHLAKDRNDEGDKEGDGFFTKAGETRQRKETEGDAVGGALQMLETGADFLLGPNVRMSVLDDLEGVADRVGPRGACGRQGGVGPPQAPTDRDLPARRVDHQLRDREWADPRRSLLEADRV